MVQTNFSQPAGLERAWQCEVYTDEGFARQSNQTLSPAGFLFIAIMCGGDYDPV